MGMNNVDSCTSRRDGETGSTETCDRRGEGQDEEEDRGAESERNGYGRRLEPLLGSTKSPTSNLVRRLVG